MSATDPAKASPLVSTQPLAPAIRSIASVPPASDRNATKVPASPASLARSAQIESAPAMPPSAPVWVDDVTNTTLGATVASIPASP